MHCRLFRIFLIFSSVSLVDFSVIDHLTFIGNPIKLS
jgi:hypothetical protein